MAVASAGPYASLHPAPDRQPRQHPTTQKIKQYLPKMPIPSTGAKVKYVKSEMQKHLYTAKIVLKIYLVYKHLQLRHLHS